MFAFKNKKKLLKIALTALLFFFRLGSDLWGQSVYVPLNHWSYEFVERLETKGVLTGILNGTKPYSREEMAGYLLQVQEKAKGRELLNSVELRQLDFLRFEFQEEFRQLGGLNGHTTTTRIQKLKDQTFVGRVFPDFVYKNYRNLINIQKDEFKVFIDPVFYHGFLYANPDSLKGTERVFERTHGFTLWGQLGTHLGFFFDFRDTEEWGTRTYPEKFDISLPGLGFVNGYGTHIWHDETVAYLIFKLPYFQIMLGKDSNFWGPGFNGALSLSTNATSYDQIKLQSKIWRLKFTYVWGFLRTFPVIRNQNSETVPKNIVAHRLDIDVAKWLDIGLYETVIFGNRRFELAYANPINFYRSAEHFLGDDDNAAIGADFEFLLIPNVKLYGELFIDDLTTGKLGSGFFGNKTAYLTGGLWVDAFKIKNLDARIEYARTRPFVYTHRSPINTYSNFNTGLGHGMGPNSDDLLLRAQYRFSKSLFVAASFESFRHGANEPDKNIGGDINRNEDATTPEFIDFLDGVRERNNRFGFEISYEVFRNLYLELNYNTASARNILLPTGVRGPVERNEFFFNLSLNR